LTTLEERIALLRAAGLDRLYVLDFEENLQVLEYDEFVRSVLRDRLGLAHFILGHNVHFGRGRRGTSASVRALAQEMGFAFSQVKSVEHEGSAISSSRIRDAIEAGDLTGATAMLGHPYLVCGPVEGGRRIGRRLGFPTANLRITHPAKLFPPPGVYAAWARVVGESGFVPAALNLGQAPTFGSGTELRLEVHLLEGSPQLYEKRLLVAFGPRLRAEKRFSAPEELARQIARDVEAVPLALATSPPWQTPRALGPSFALEGDEDPSE
jgi:riboflavin kinase/FMN adenylyltransferase